MGVNTAAGAAYSSPRYNLIYAMVSTVLSRIIAPGIPACSIITNDGDWDLQRKAALLGIAVEGIVYGRDVAVEAVRALRDCLVYGSGFMRFDADTDGNICADRVFPETLWCEMYDGREGKPRALGYFDYISRDILLARYKDKPELLKKINATLPVAQSSYANDLVGTRVIPYCEVYHLPSRKGASDGRVVKALPDVTLEDREWSEQSFPFASIRFDDSLSGFYGRGLAELLYPHQSELNRITKAEAQAWSQVALPRLWIDINSKINENHATSSRSGGIIRGIGNPPTVLNWSAVHPEFVQYKQWVIQSAYEFVGVSQMSASGNKPAGLNSGAAQREFMDIQSDRFALLSDKWQQFWTDIAKQIIRCGRALYSDDKTFKLPVIGKNFLKEIPWKDVDMEDDQYRLKVFPVSSLPRSPAGRLASVQEMMSANLITREEGLKLLEFPDLDDTLALENASEDNARWTAYQLLHEGKMVPPDSLQNLQLCVAVVQKEALRAINAGAPDEKVSLCRAWLAAARIKLQPPAPPMPPPGPAPAVGPGGPPAALAKGPPMPVNPMLPPTQPQ